jgi:hypothetical protein
MKFAVSFAAGIVCGLIFAASFLGTPLKWSFTNYFGFFFLVTLFLAVRKIKQVTDDTTWVLPLWLGVATAVVLGVIFRLTLYNSLTH